MGFCRIVGADSNKRIVVVFLHERPVLFVNVLNGVRTCNNCHMVIRSLNEWTTQFRLSDEVFQPCLFAFHIYFLPFRVYWISVIIKMMNAPSTLSVWVFVFSVHICVYFVCEIECVHVCIFFTQWVCLWVCVRRRLLTGFRSPSVLECSASTNLYTVLTVSCVPGNNVSSNTSSSSPSFLNIMQTVGSCEAETIPNSVFIIALCVLRSTTTPVHKTFQIFFIRLLFMGDYGCLWVYGGK